MRRPLVLVLVLACLLCTAGAANADDEKKPAVKPTEKPLLWVAHRHDATIYLYGTLHAPDDRILAVPPSVSRALAASDTFISEVLMSESVQHQILYYMRLPRNRPLKTVIPEPLFERVAKILDDAGHSIESFEFIKPWRLDLVVGELDAPKDTRAGMSVDQLLYERARDAGKALDELETVYGQISLFDNLPYPEQARLLEETVDRLESDRAKGINGVDSMIQAYLSGDEERLMKELDSYFDFDVEADVKLYDRMNAKRNEKMVGRLMGKIEEKPDKSWFVAVGAAHLPRADGMLALLELKAFDIWRAVDIDDVPESREEATAKAVRIWSDRLEALRGPDVERAVPKSRRCRAKRRCRWRPFRVFR